MLFSGGRRFKRTRMTWAMVVMTALGAASTGCVPLGWLGPNLTVYFNIPLGLNGNPGYYNPFGIVQAIVNSVLGSNFGNNNGDAGLPGENGGGGNVGGIL